MSLRRYTIKDALKDTYYQLPKFLFEDKYKGLNNDARIIYALLRDRLQLSIKNKNFITGDGELFLFFPREEIMETLSLSKPTVIKAFNVLKDNNLVQEVRQGLGKPNKVFLMVVTNEPQNHKKFTSGSKNSLPQDVNEIYPINKEFKKTDIYDSQSVSHNWDGKNESREAARNYLKTLLSDVRSSAVGYNVAMTADIEEVMLDVLTSTADYITIGGEKINTETVKETYLKLDYLNIEHVINKCTSVTHEIKNYKGYIRTCLYNSLQEFYLYGTNSNNRF
jgi:hypothetical protein